MEGGGCVGLSEAVGLRDRVRKRAVKKTLETSWGLAWCECACLCQAQGDESVNESEDKLRSDICKRAFIVVEAGSGSI